MTTANTNSGGHTMTGAVLCVATIAPCTGATPGNTAVGIGVTDKFGNAETYGAGGVTFAAGQDIFVQTASGGVFDTTNLPSAITCGSTAGYACPVAGQWDNEPFNYFQGANYGTAGVLTATITGTYGGSSFSVSGSSGTIETSTFSQTGLGTGNGAFDTTGHAAFVATNVQAGNTITLEFVLGTAQSNVPVTIAVCDNGSCGGTTKGYSGTFSTASGITNSSGIFSSTLTVDTTAGHVAIVNATVLAPLNGTPKNTFTIDSAAITTVAGPAAKFTVFVGPDPTLSPSPITESIPSATDYVNVAVTDKFNNPVSTAGPAQVQVTLVANPATLSTPSAFIPTGCWETNGTLTASNGCSGSFNSFGPIEWTLPATGSATISASGVLGGVVVTSATDTITVVSKLPTVNVFLPKPLSGYIYTSSPNVQFRGWANVSAGYNNCIGGNGPCPAEAGRAPAWLAPTLSGASWPPCRLV